MGLSPEYVVNGLVQRGIPRNAALGFAGNFVVESRLDPSINEIAPLVKGSRGGFGLAQWTGPRRRQLEAFAGSKGKPVSDPEVQMDFLAWELQNTEKNAAKSIFAASDPTEAARLVSERFLRPGIPHLDRRLSATAEIAGGTFTGGGGSDTLAGGGSDTLSGDQEVLASASPEDDFSDIDAFLGLTNQQSYQIVPPTPMQAAPIQGASASGDFSDIDAFLGITPAAPRYREQALPGPMEPPPAYDGVSAVATPQQPSNIRGDLSAPGFGAAQQFAEQAGQSPAGYLPNIAMSALSGLSGAINYGIGGVADAAVATGLMEPNSAKRLARDVAAMPDAFAGSPQAFAGMPTQVGRAATVPTAGEGAAKAAARVEPPMSRFAPASTAAVTADDVQTLLRQAQGRGGSSRAAIRRLAEIAKVDPEAAAAADRLGIDLPVDVFSRETAVIETAGQIRGIKGGAATIEFRDAVKEAAARADKLVTELDQNTKLSDVSQEVFTSLNATTTKLEKQSDALYKAIDASIPKPTPVKADTTMSVLSQTMRELGGSSRMSAQEKKLLADLTNAEEPLTYAALIRNKQDIGRAMAKGQGPFADVNQATLERLYGALAEDQLAAVQEFGGGDMVASLKTANGLVSQRKKLEERIVKAFGKDMQGSIASTLRTAVSTASKGDLGSLNRVLNVVPKELQQRAVASAIADLAAGKGAAGEGAFSFANFANTYRGLRNNPPVYKKIVGIMGKENAALLEDLYRVSAAINRAEAAIEKTGKANQALRVLSADGLISSVMNTTAGKTAVRATTTGLFGAAGGLPAAIAADSVGAALTAGRPDRVAAAGKLLSSEPFKALAVEMATKPAVSTKSQNAVLNSPAFRAFVRSSGISDPQAWLAAAIAGSVVTQTQTQGNAQ